MRIMPALTCFYRFSCVQQTAVHLRVLSEREFRACAKALMRSSMHYVQGQGAHSIGACICGYWIIELACMPLQARLHHSIVSFRIKVLKTVCCHMKQCGQPEKHSRWREKQVSGQSLPHCLLLCSTLSLCGLCEMIRTSMVKAAYLRHF